MASICEFSENNCCLLCKGNEVDEVTYGTIYKIGEIEVHYFCLLLSSTVVQNGDDEEGILGFLPDDILVAANKCSEVRCTLCNNEGANILCAAPRCRVVFHYPCGIKNDSSHRFSGKFPSYCQKHRIEQKIPKKIYDVIKDVQLDCVICLDKVELNNSTIWAPCCQKNALFHRRCLQSMAFSFGLYALKCPLCNNEIKFRKALVANGVFIPEQDASWETEPNAFSELLERYNRCDAVKCVCPKGCEFSKPQSLKWKIILCSDCGSQGIHKYCLKNENIKKSIKIKKKIIWKCGSCERACRVAEEHETENHIRYDSTLTQNDISHCMNCRVRLEKTTFPVTESTYLL